MTIANSSSVGWVNADGLRVKFPTQEVIQGKGGEIGGVHLQKVLEIDVDYTTFSGATGATVVNLVDMHLFLPNGAIIEQIDFAVGAAWDSTGNDVALNFGLVRRSDFSTIIDADGLVDSLAKSVIDTPNALVKIYNEANSTYAGAFMDDDGGVATYDSVICCFWENHAPTVGTGKLRIYFR